MKRTILLASLIIVVLGSIIFRPNVVFSQATRNVFVTPTIITPNAQVTVTIGTALVVILDQRDILRDVNWCITVENTDGADDFVNVQVEQRADGTGIWTVLSWDDCDTLGEGVSCVYCVSGNAYRYMRVRGAAADANQVSARVIYTANRG